MKLLTKILQIGVLAVTTWTAQNDQTRSLHAPFSHLTPSTRVTPKGQETTVKRSIAENSVQERSL
jgi:hypothetical protein